MFCAMTGLTLFADGAQECISGLAVSTLRALAPPNVRYAFHPSVSPDHLECCVKGSQVATLPSNPLLSTRPIKLDEQINQPLSAPQPWPPWCVACSRGSTTPSLTRRQTSKPLWPQLCQLSEVLEEYSNICSAPSASSTNVLWCPAPPLSPTACSPASFEGFCAADLTRELKSLQLSPKTAGIVLKNFSSTWH